MENGLKIIPKTPGCTTLKLLCKLLKEHTNSYIDPIKKTLKAYALYYSDDPRLLMTANGLQGKAVKKGMISHILRYHYRLAVRPIADLFHYRSNQPVYRNIDLFESELMVNRQLKRDYEAILAMLE